MMTTNIMHATYILLLGKCVLHSSINEQNRLEGHKMHKIWMILSCSLFLAACNQPVVQSQQQAELQKSTAMHAVLLDQPNLFHEETNLKVDQQFNSAENPTDAQITVEQTQLDDSVLAIRTEYQLKRDQDVWKVVNKKQSYQCARGENTQVFQVELCP
jgi:PBP1b-binding outer membrane lipoprotein LpoB